MPFIKIIELNKWHCKETVRMEKAGNIEAARKMTDLGHTTRKRGKGREGMENHKKVFKMTKFECKTTKFEFPI